MELITLLLVVVIAALTGMVVEIHHINKRLDGIEVANSPQKLPELDEKELKDIDDANADAVKEFNKALSKLNAFMLDEEEDDV